VNGWLRLAPLGFWRTWILVRCDGCFAVAPCAGFLSLGFAGLESAPCFRARAVKAALRAAPPSASQTESRATQRQRAGKLPDQHAAAKVVGRG